MQPGSGVLAIRDNLRKKEGTVLGTILIVFLVMVFLGVMPTWSHSYQWGYAPTKGVGLVLGVALILVLFGHI